MKYDIKTPLKISRYSTAILVPRHLNKKYRKITGKYGNFRNFLHQNIWVTNRMNFSNIHNKRGRIKYQDKGLSLKKYDFRPYESDWEKLRLVAWKYRVSMMKILMQMILDWGEDGVVATTRIKKMTLNIQIISSKRRIYISVKSLSC